MRGAIRALVAMALAGIAGASLVLEKRRSRRMRAGSRGKAITAEPAAPTPGQGESEPQPLLSPMNFILSHFSMLVILLAMMIAGLAMHGVRRYPPEPTWYVEGGDAKRGRAALVMHGCGGCHIIPGIGNATGRVGPGLDGFAQRMYIGGQLPNTPENLIAWLQDPQHFAPGTAMPNLLITDAAARDMAAFLYAHP